MRSKASTSSSVTTPSAFAILAPRPMTAMVKATPAPPSSRWSKSMWPATAPAIAPIGPPPKRNPAAAPPNFPQMDMGRSIRTISSELR
jgi:hypothetical protein